MSKVTLVPFTAPVDRSSEIAVLSPAGVVQKKYPDESLARRGGKYLADWHSILNNEFPRGEIKTPQLEKISGAVLDMSFEEGLPVAKFLESELPKDEVLRFAEIFEKFLAVKIKRNLLHSNLDLNHFLYVPPKSSGDSAKLVILNPQASTVTREELVQAENTQMRELFINKLSQDLREAVLALMQKSS